MANRSESQRANLLQKESDTSAERRRRLSETVTRYRGFNDAISGKSGDIRYAKDNVYWEGYRKGQEVRR